MAAIEVFSRYELKFMPNREQYHNILKGIEQHMQPDEHSQNGNTYTISNVYFDTPDDRLVSTALRHESKYRYKIRMRTYDPSLPTAFLEIKKKYNGLTSKRRTLLYVDDALQLLLHGVEPPEQPFMNMQITNELLRISRELPLLPKTVLSYDRRAYFGASGNEKDLRVTFDNNIRARRDRTDFRLGTDGEQLLDSEHYIMEVKVEHSVPMWLAALLSENRVYRIKFSKYGTEYKRYLRTKKGAVNQ